MNKPWDIVWDVEANNLLDREMDYSVVPYKLKPSFVLHCIVVDIILPDGRLLLYGFHDGPKYEFDGREHREVVGGVEYVLEAGYEPVDYIHRPLASFQEFVKVIPEGSLVRGHNIINYDLLAMKLYYGIPFEIERDMSKGAPFGDDTWAGTPVIFDDTLVRAKTLNPDRLGGNSLDNLAKDGDVEKIAFRKHLPQDSRFNHFAADMLYYNIFDCKSNRVVARKLDLEMQTYDWGDKWLPAIKLEKAVMELITRQQHRGFKFNSALAEECVAELDELMEERRIKIEKILPERPATKKVMNDSSPPVKQFKANGEPSAHMIRFAGKMGAEIVEDKFVYNGVAMDMPLKDEPLVTTMPATINDTTHIKDWLISIGWVPLEYKEKDITVDTKKIKLEPERLEKAIERYIDQTLSTNFMYDRVEHLMFDKTKLPTRQRLKAPQAERIIRAEFSKRMERKSGIKVVTNPSFTVGQDKEICPNLKALAESREELNCITDIVEYLTYRHRRNSILGGGAEWDEDEEPEKGFVSAVREDGRIPTPADTCGAATSRMKHRLVANVPRVSSLYGKKMRSLFGVDDDCYQIGYDFDSLEARQESHFCWPFERGNTKEYCQSLLLDKPFDVHTKMASAISEIIGKDFGRQPAKNVKYGCTYGAQAAKVAKTIGSDLMTGTLVYDAFWEAAAPLKGLKTALQVEWEQFGKKRIIGIDGRLIPTRSAHAILNSKFQSSGVICAKRAMVVHDRKMSAEGLVHDFFTESLEGKSWCQQLIAYHDEAQLEVDKASVKLRKFAEKAEAQAWKDKMLEETGQIWSDIKDSPFGGVYVGYCRAGELAVHAVNEVGKDYDMEVDLTAGYMIEKSWAGCH